MNKTLRLPSITSKNMTTSAALDAIFHDLKNYYSESFPMNDYLPNIIKNEVVESIIQYENKFQETVVYHDELDTETRTLLGSLIHEKRQQ